MKRRYRRYFIMLELGDKTYKAYENKEAKGHAKIEIKNGQGTLSIHCQNLRPSSNNNRYRWYLINTNKEGPPTIVEVGPMEVDERGKGDMVCGFNTENVKGSAEQIDNFNVLVLSVQNKEDKSKLHTPLVGYTEKENLNLSSWKYALGKYLYIPVEDEEPKKEGLIKETIKPPMDENEQVQERKVDNIIADLQSVIMISNDAIDSTIDESIHRPKIMLTDESKDIVTDESKELVADESQHIIVNKFKDDVADEPHHIVVNEFKDNVADEARDVIYKDDICKGEDNKKKDKEEKKEEYREEGKEEENNEYEEQMQAYVENSLKGFSRANPFIDDFNGYIWWQIPYNDQTMYRAYMPFILYLDSLKNSTSPHIPEILNKVLSYNHHIFGIYYDENNKAKNYVYGIPDKNIPIGGVFGTNIDFVKWHPCNNVVANIESQGYLILTIDPKTGNLL